LSIGRKFLKNFSGDAGLEVEEVITQALDPKAARWQECPPYESPT
jgi:hypothetical protein